MIDIPHDRASSAVAFISSMQHKMELLMKAGDVVEDDLRNRKGKPRPENIFQTEEEGRKVIAEILKRVEQGDSWRNASFELGYNDCTTKEWAKRRGMYQAKSLKALRAHQPEQDRLSDKVDEWRAKGLTLKDALKKVGGINADQYHRSRARVGKTRTRELNR